MYRICVSLLFFAVGAVQFSGQNTGSNPAPVVVGESESAPYFPHDKLDGSTTSKKKSRGGTSDPKSADRTLLLKVGAYSRTGELIRGLNSSDFRVIIDDQEVEVISSHTSPPESRVVMLIDASPSSETQLSIVKNLAARIVRGLPPSAKVTIVAFNFETKFLIQDSLDRAKALKAVEKLSVGNGTSFYDAFLKVNERFTSRRELEPVTLIVMSDGVDTTSRVSGRETLLRAEQGNVLTYLVYLDTLDAFINGPGKKKTSWVLGTPEPPEIRIPQLQKEYAQARRFLSDLLSLSGGRVFQSTEDFDIVADLEARYLLAVRLPAAGPRGTRHSIKVVVRRPGLKVLAKGSIVD